MTDTDLNIHINQTIRLISESLGRHDGNVYFEYLVKYITRYSDMSCGIAYELLENDKNHYRLIADWVSGNDANTNYGQLDKSTIRSLISGEMCSIKNKIHNTFPKDKFISKLQLKSLVVFSLYDSNKNVIGILIFLSKKSFPADNGILSIIDSQIPRACAELDRMRTTRNLNILESNYNHLIETVLDVIWTTDSSGLIVEISRSCSAIYEYTQEEIIGRHCTDFMSKKSSEEFNRHFSLLIDGIRIYDITSEHYTKSGRAIQVNYSLTPNYNEHGVFIGATGTTRDISASVQAQTIIKNNSELFSSILSRLPVIFFRVDEGGYLIDIRGNGLKRMGVEDMDWAGKPGYGLFIGMDDKINSALSGKTVVFESQGKYQGNPWWFSTSMFFDSWAGFGAVGFSVDITEQKVFEERLVDLLNSNQKLAQRLIEVQEDERRNLSRELHDELGQTITAVKSLAKAITSNSGGQYTEVRSLGNSIIDLSGRLYEVVNNIMQRLRPDIIDGLGFDESIKNCIVRSQLETIGVNCNLNIVGDINEFDDIVKITIYRIIQECLTNISKHAMASNVNILIQCDHDYTNTRYMMKFDALSLNPFRNREHKIDTVRIEILDDGIGMAIDDGLLITKNKNRHGLQGIYERVTAIGGSLEITSDPGEGLKVLVILALGTDSDNLATYTGAEDETTEDVDLVNTDRASAR